MLFTYINAESYELRILVLLYEYIFSHNLKAHIKIQEAADLTTLLQTVAPLNIVS